MYFEALVYSLAANASFAYWVSVSLFAAEFEPRDVQCVSEHSLGNGGLLVVLEKKSNVVLFQSSSN